MTPKSLLNIVLTFLVLFLLGVSQYALAQKKGYLLKFDTLVIKGNSYFLINDTSVYVHRDSALVIADTINNTRLRWPINNPNYFYQNLEDRFSRNKFTKELFNIVFTTPKPKKDSVVLAPISSDNYEKYKGRLIGEIIIKQLDVFGPSLNDTTRQAKLWIERAVNRSHIDTRKYVIRNSLLLKVGERLDPYLLPDNERLLRSLPFIKDARIYVIPRNNNSNTVDILVITKDIAALSFDFQPNGFNSGLIGLDLLNILGTGQELDNRFYYNTDQTISFGYQGNFKIANLMNTYISSDVFYINRYQYSSLGVRLNRRFVTPEIKYAGGIELYTSNENRSFMNEDASIWQYNLAYEYQDIWLARAFGVNFKNQKLKDRSRLVWGQRITHYQHYLRPFVSADSNQQFRNRMQYLNSFSISNRNYYRDQFIYGFGRTEDIPIGYSLEFVQGFEWGEFYNRSYFGVSTSKADKIPNFGYLYGRWELGSYFRGNQAEQGAIKLDGRLITNLWKVKRYSLRQLFSFNYTTGLQRLNVETISVSNSSGIRGLNGLELQGKQRLSFSFETMAITPFNFLDFRIITFAFADVGFISGENENLLAKKPFQGYGLGFRIRNDNLAFNIFQVRLVYYPVLPQGASPFDFNVLGEQSSRFSDFDTGAPRTIEYR